MPAPPQLDLSEYLPYLINRVGSALVDDFVQSALARRHLSIAMWRVLAALSNDGGRRQIDLAGTTSIDVSTLSRVVTRLVKMGLVTRMRSTTNSREVVVRLTAKGTAVLADAIPRAIAAEKMAVAGVPANDLAVVRRSLRRMYQNLMLASSSNPQVNAVQASAAVASSAASRRPAAAGRTRR